MAYSKFTTISGNKASGEFKCYTPRGHWSPDKALAYAKSHGMTGKIQITHRIIDLSGHGRGGHDGRWAGDIEAGTLIKEASWSEFGKEHL